VGEIEKLIKTKVEIEGLEFEEDLPDIRKQGRINDGRRMYHEDGGDNGRPAPRREERAPRGDYSRPSPRQTPVDPFFNKPYEAPADVVAPAWEATEKPSNRISANIKPKRKVAALFKAE
jgi:hypothetical protein